MLKTTTQNVAGITPDVIHQLIVLPVEAQSVAMQVSTIVPIDSTRVQIPRVVKDPASAWTAEGEEIGLSDPQIDELIAVPAKVAGLTKISSELAADSTPQATDIIGQGLVRSITTRIDEAYFGSNGGNAVQPEGLADLSGVTGVSAGEAWANTDPFAEAVSNAAGLGGVLGAFVANPADALALAKLKEASGSNRPLLQPDATMPSRMAILGTPLMTSPAVAAGTVWGIPKERSIVVRRNDVDLQVDRSVYFTSDNVAVRATMRVTFAFPDPAAIQKISLGA